jgi:AcrR family transcriptional regulator
MTRADSKSPVQPGQRRDSSRQVLSVQRSRLIAAAIDCCEEGPLTRLTVARIIARARVSRKTFYEVFIDAEDCFLAAFDDVYQHIRERALAGYADGQDWRSGTRAAVGEVLSLLESEVGLARLCIVDAFAAGERVLARRTEIIDEIGGAIDAGRRHSSTPPPPEGLTGRAIAGGALALLHSLLVEEATPRLTEWAGPLMAMIVIPYLGRAEACQEIKASPSKGPPRSTRHRAPELDVLAGLQMRLTYRTVRVLGAVGQHPDASNRDIADAAGIYDQGQVSKLLKRLARLDLVENHGGGQQKGASNAWRLTDLGARTHRLALGRRADRLRPAKHAPPIAPLRRS